MELAAAGFFFCSLRCVFKITTSALLSIAWFGLHPVLPPFVTAPSDSAFELTRRLLTLFWNGQKCRVPFGKEAHI